MKELQEIVKAFASAENRGLKTALATVVHVVGSAYRHEGARMLICENGELTGAISGGCLEGDALRKARLAIAENKKILVTYDTTDEDDATLGVGLGCNGIIKILLEPIDAADNNNPIQLFKRFLTKRQHAVLGTFFSLENKLANQPGTCLLLTELAVTGNFLDAEIKEQFISDAQKALQRKSSFIKEYSGQALSCFVEYLKPPVHILVFGAGNDAIPLVQFASILGWDVTVIDGRSNYVTSARFPLAKQVLIAKPDNALTNLTIDEWTVAVLITHNYNYDIAILEQLLNYSINYIGALGPAKKLTRMLEELAEKGIETDQKQSKIFGPTGLDIGSETPEEIALSIIAEIKAVLSKRDGQSLQFRINDKSADSISGGKQSRFNSCQI